jgi:uncharacterized protein YecE (DUF72 family)
VSTTALGKAHVGCSGWSYKHWVGDFYPAGLPPREWFGHYAASFGTVELNNTFYRLPPAETFAAWGGQAPAGFVYAVKMNRYGTHRRRLREPEAWLPNHLTRVGLLGPALGPQLVQLPPRWRSDAGRLDHFCACAREAEQAAGTGRLRWALEVRDASWLNDDVFGVLAAYGFALCVHDLLPDHPWARTTDWAYVRFHGAGGAAPKYGGEYGPAGLRKAAGLAGRRGRRLRVLQQRPRGRGRA